MTQPKILADSALMSTAPPTYPIGLYHNESTGVNASYFDGRAGFSAMNGGNQAQYYSAPGYGGYLNSFGFTRESWYNN